LRWDEWRGRTVASPMTNYEVVRSFVEEGRHRRGGNVFADERDGALYSYGYHFPLAVRLPDGFLVNGSHVSQSTTRHQSFAFGVLDGAKARYAVVPFDAVGAALRGSARRSPWPAYPDNSTREAVAELQANASIVVPSNGERWREVRYRKPDGTEATRYVHTLGDSVLRVRERYYISAVDETGVGRGLYFLTELQTRTAPRTLAEALETLKPESVLNAEAAGLEGRRQGEWFAIPDEVRTKDLMRDVRRGLAVYHQHHVLGRDGHHQLTEAVVCKYGPNKGRVYGRGTMRHTRGEHRLLRLPDVWFRIVHSTQGQSYSLGGRGLQFD
jgi:hypothetical protein